ncbi:hypothetical protein BJ165DRAFT_671836 [Panaeolus papilionaceus]|nr:hypothetical protein BJ165DRAFT_671836 [Panaeolus papilionaceus]
MKRLLDEGPRVQMEPFGTGLGWGYGALGCGAKAMIWLRRARLVVVFLSSLYGTHPRPFLFAAWHVWHSVLYLPLPFLLLVIPVFFFLVEVASSSLCHASRVDTQPLHLVRHSLPSMVTCNRLFVCEIDACKLDDNGIEGELINFPPITLPPTIWYFGHSSSRSKAVLTKITSSVPHLQKGPKSAQKQASDDQLHAYNPLDDIAYSRSVEEDVEDVQDIQPGAEHDIEDDQQDAELQNYAHDIPDDSEQNDDDDRVLNGVEKFNDGQYQPEDTDQERDDGDDDETESHRFTQKRRWNTIESEDEDDDMGQQNHAVANPQSGSQNRNATFRILKPFSKLVNLDNQHDVSDPPAKSKKRKVTHQPTSRVLRPRTNTQRSSVPPGDDF